MRTPMSPNDIEVMLHYYVSSAPHPRIHASAVRDAVDRFVQAGLLREKDDTHETTEGGKMYVETLCAVALPTQKWIQ